MKYLLILLLCLICTRAAPALSFGTAQSYATSAYQAAQNPVKPIKKIKKNKKNQPKDNIPFYLIKISLLLSVTVGLILLFLLFQPVFIFAIAFFLAFLWVLSGFAASMSFIMMLIRAPSNLREQNEELAAYVFLYMFSRILLLVLLFLMADFIIAIIVAISFVPAFIVHILMISWLLSTHRSRNAVKDMFGKKSEPAINE